MMKLSFRRYREIEQQMRIDPNFSTLDLSEDERRVFVPLTSDRRTMLVNEDLRDPRASHDPAR